MLPLLVEEIHRLREYHMRLLCPGVVKGRPYCARPSPALVCQTRVTLWLLMITFTRRPLVCCLSVRTLVRADSSKHRKMDHSNTSHIKHDVQQNIHNQQNNNSMYRPSSPSSSMISHSSTSPADVRVRRNSMDVNWAEALANQNMPQSMLGQATNLPAQYLAQAAQGQGQVQGLQGQQNLAPPQVQVQAGLMLNGNQLDATLYSPTMPLLPNPGMMLPPPTPYSAGSGGSTGFLDPSTLSTGTSALPMDGGKWLQISHALSDRISALRCRLCLVLADMTRAWLGPTRFVRYKLGHVWGSVRMGIRDRYRPGNRIAEWDV
jgi:hypothetical protein